MEQLFHYCSQNDRATLEVAVRKSHMLCGTRWAPATRAWAESGVGVSLYSQTPMPVSTPHLG